MLKTGAIRIILNNAHPRVQILHFDSGFLFCLTINFCLFSGVLVSSVYILLMSQLSILKYVSSSCDLNESESGTSESDTESYPESSCGQTSVLSSDSPCCSQSIANAETNKDLNDPSLPLPSNETKRNARIRKGPYQPRLNNYTVTRHNGKARSFCQRWYDFYNWLEYSPITNKMYCFFCRIFTHKVMGPGNTGTIDPAFATNGTQAQRWKKARSVLSRHQSCFVHKQSALFHADFLK